MSVKVSSVCVAADSATTRGGYECYDCGKMFRRESILRRHREFSHATAAGQTARDADSARPNRCQTCRRPFATRAALLEHLSIAHGTVRDSAASGEPCSTTTKVECTGEAVCLLPVEDCCVDDEICITADDEFDVSVEGDGKQRVSASSSERTSPQNRSTNHCRSTTSSSCSSGALCLSGTVDAVVSVPRLQATSLHCKNNNNVQTRNKNMLSNTVSAVSITSSTSSNLGRQTLGSSNIVKSLVAATTSASTDDISTSRRVSADTTTPTTGAGSTNSAAVYRTTAEASKSTGARGNVTHRGSIYSAVDMQGPQKSPLEADTFREVRKPEDVAISSRFLSTPTTQKIIFYVKTEPNHHQQIAYCAAESVTCGGGGKAGSGPCQFVCPVCAREFTSEKYLSMHVSSIHRAGTDVASVIALETAASPRIDGHRVSVAGSPGNAADAPVASPATAAGPLAAHPTSSTSVGGAKSHWTCNICQKTFAQNSSYKNHIRTHSDDRPYVCSICSIGFKERYHLKKHELFKHTTTLNETCRICGKRFKDSTAVRAHERIHSDIRPYGCMLCGKTFKTSECLWHHENRSKTCGKMASRGKQVGVAVAAQTGVLTVPRQRQRRDAVNTLTVTTRPPRPSNLVKLHQPSPPVEDLKPELNDLLPPVTVYNPADSDIKPEVVESPNPEVGGGDSDEVVIKTEPDCELFDVNLSAMLDTTDPSFGDIWPTLDDFDSVPVDYTTDSHGIPSSPDPICSSPDTTDAESTRSADEPSTFVGMTSSNAGISGSGAAKRYDCERCDKRFASAATLAKHLQVHAEVRPYRCALCDIGFKLKVHLKKHNLYRHSEEYPCECSICGKRFKDSSAVRLHERIHSTARPFQCAHCGKSFKTRENLWGHRNRGPCEQRITSSLLMTPSMTSYPVATSDSVGSPQFVANNVRLFHSAEFGPILGVPVNAKLVFAGTEKSEKTDSRPTTVTVHTSSTAKSTTPGSTSLLTAGSSTNLRRVSAVRVGDTTRLAVSKVTPVTTSAGSSSTSVASGLSLVSVPTAVVTPIKRDMIDDRKLSTLVATTTSSVLAGNVVIATPSAGHVINRKRSGSGLAHVSPAPPCKLTRVDEAKSAVEKCSTIHRLLASDDTLLSPDTEQNLNDALTALAATTSDTMMVAGDCLPPVGDPEPDWPTTTPGDYAEVLGDDWNELMSTNCDQIFTSTDEDDVLSECDSLSDYHRLVSSPSLGQSVAGHSPTLSGGEDDSSERGLADTDDHTDLISSAADTMWCNWAPENDLGGLLL